MTRPRRTAAVRPAIPVRPAGTGGAVVVVCLAVLTVSWFGGPPFGIAAGRPSSCFGAAARDAARPCNPGPLRFTVTPTPEAALLEPGAFCRPLQASPRICTFGVPPARATTGVALIGDSHAAHWRAALSVVAQRRRWRGFSISRNSCPFELARTTGTGRCAGWARSVIAWLRRHREITTVVVSANATSGVRIPPGRSFVGAKVDGFRRAWSALPPSVGTIVVLRDVPRSSLRTRDCVAAALARHRDAGTRCARPRKAAVETDLQTIAANRSPGDRAVAVDLTPLMCDRTRCFPVVGGALVIRDIGHLTATFSRSAGPALGRAIAEARRQRASTAAGG